MGAKIGPVQRKYGNHRDLGVIDVTVTREEIADQVTRVAQWWQSDAVLLVAPDGAARFGLVAAAGELATDYGLTGWAPGEAARAASACFAAWLAGRGTVGAAEPAAMLAQVRRFLESHGEARFAPMDADTDRPTINRAGFRRPTPEGDEYFVLREAFRAELAAGFDPDAVARALAEAGALLRDTDGGTTRNERLPGIGKARVYRITPAIWGCCRA